MAENHIPCTNSAQNVPIVVALRKALGSNYNRFEGRPAPGKVTLGCSTRQVGWTLRACADAPAMKTAALLWGRSVHTKFVQVMVEDHYKYCYPNRRQAIDAYRKFFLTLDCDITRKNGITASCPIDGSLLMPHAAELAKLMLEFAKPLISV